MKGTQWLALTEASLEVLRGVGGGIGGMMRTGKQAGPPPRAASPRALLMWIRRKGRPLGWCSVPADALLYTPRSLLAFLVFKRWDEVPISSGARTGAKAWALLGAFVGNSAVDTDAGVGMFAVSLERTLP